MKIIVHAAHIDAGYASLCMTNIDKAVLRSKVADRCREDWDSRTWYDGNGNVRQPIDTTGYNDNDIIEEYFAGEEGPSIEWEELEVDLSPKCGALGTVCLGGLKVQRTGPTYGAQHMVTGYGALIEGSLIPDMPIASAALESLIMALMAAGFPVHLPEFAEAVNTAVEAIANRDEEDDV